MEYYGNNDYRSYLAHHGIKGQKWGVRRFQNPDGSLTSAGKKRKEKNDAYVKRKLDVYRKHYEQDKKNIQEYQNSAKEIRKHGYNMLVRQGYDPVTAKRAVEVLAAKRERQAKEWQKSNAARATMIKKLNDLDTSSLSYRQTKKYVNKAIKEWQAVDNKAYKEFINSEESIAYMKSIRG